MKRFQFDREHSEKNKRNEAKIIAEIIMCLALTEDEEGIKTVLKAAVIQVLGSHFTTGR